MYQSWSDLAISIWHVAVVRHIKSLAAVFNGLNKINVSISQILSDNFLRLGSDKSCGWEIMIFFLLFHFT